MQKAVSWPGELLFFQVRRGWGRKRHSGTSQLECVKVAGRYMCGKGTGKAQAGCRNVCVHVTQAARQCAQHDRSEWQGR